MSQREKALPMTEEEAEKEFKEIQAELNKEHGVEPEPEVKKPKDSDESEDSDATESEEVEDDSNSEKDEKKVDEDLDKKEGEEKEEPTPELRRPSRTVPARKYQELKRTSREELETKEAKIAELTRELDEAKTTSAMSGKIKDFAEKHSMSEDMVKDLANILGKSAQLDPKTEGILKKTEIALQKQEANEAFENEFEELIQDHPEAASLREDIRKRAYKDDNLKKSLFEIYIRQVKPTIEATPPKKKTGEPSRGSGSNRVATTGFDLAKVAEKVEKQIPGALEGLDGEQQDKVFDYLSKKGSRYSRKS